MMEQTKEVVEFYLASNTFKEDEINTNVEYQKDDSLVCQILSVNLLNPKQKYNLFEEITYEIIYEIKEDLPAISIGIDLLNGENYVFRHFDTDKNENLLEYRPKGVYSIKGALPNFLKAGDYTLFVHTSKPHGGYIHMPKNLIKFAITDENIDVNYKSYSKNRNGAIIGNLDYKISLVDGNS